MLSSSDYSTDNCFRLRRAELTHNVRYRAALLGPALAFGYPAYPNLADQKQLLALLNADEIGFTLSEEDQLDPEQSTLAIHHPPCEVFLCENLRRSFPEK